jgi:hypothetical protein
MLDTTVWHFWAHNSNFAAFFNIKKISPPFFGFFPQNKIKNHWNTNTQKQNFTVQWEQNSGKCGTCGDAYHLKTPRPHESGGDYGKGIITRRYAAGQVINFLNIPPIKKNFKLTWTGEEKSFKKRCNLLLWHECGLIG